jgi:ribosomal protein S18 acetylase RimI-like enzyme
MAAVEFRQATQADAAALIQALRALGEALGDAFAADEPGLKKAIGRGICHAVIAEARGMTMGVALFSPVYSTIYGGAGIFVTDLWVADAVRGQGLGEMMLTEVWSRQEKAWGACYMKLSVGLDNGEARQFYQRLGFEPAETETTMLLTRAPKRAGQGRGGSKGKDAAGGRGKKR